MSLVLLTGCAQLGLPQSSDPGPVPVAAAPARPLDPIAAFAAGSGPGAATTLTLDSGRAAPVRVLRAYNAASGRECREVLVGGGMEERTRTICQADGRWVDARPLLRGGGAQRP